MIVCSAGPSTAADVIAPRPHPLEPSRIDVVVYARYATSVVARNARRSVHGFEAALVGLLHGTAPSSKAAMPYL